MAEAASAARRWFTSAKNCCITASCRRSSLLLTSCRCFCGRRRGAAEWVRVGTLLLARPRRNACRHMTAACAGFGVCVSVTACSERALIASGTLAACNTHPQHTSARDHCGERAQCMVRAGAAL